MNVKCQNGLCVSDYSTVEVCLKNVHNQPSTVTIKRFLTCLDCSLPLHEALKSDLPTDIKHINLLGSNEEPIPYMTSKIKEQIKSGRLRIFIYSLNDEEREDEMLEGEDELPAASHWLIPNTAFHQTWETLIYDFDIKNNLLNYAVSGLLFAEKGVNQSVISWNRVVLLHGPPGTGKTSLCHALAQKLSIRLSDKFSSFSLLEVNSHSLFSKWFSESGKLVMKMFNKIHEMISNEDHLVFLLIDEVESLTSARASVCSGTEPSDAIRVVNALLTEIDKLKRHKNVMILTTSNVTGKIDLAFVDRADIKFLIDLPSPYAIYSILCSCVNELIHVGIIQSKDILLSNFRREDEKKEIINGSTMLWKISNKSVGLSGRTLRKLPFLCHARFVNNRESVSLNEFLDALSRIVDIQFQERKDLIKT